MSDTITNPNGSLEIPIRIVAYEDDGLQLATGAIEVPADTYPDGLTLADVKRLLAALLRELADELDEQADADQLVEGQLDNGDQAEGAS